jgi:serine/threonine-protein kinase
MSGAPLAAGTRLGPYRVEGFLARGSTGEVYRAVDERLERRVALKLVPPWLAEDERVRTRFLAEARAAASLDHPNVLPVYEAGDAGGTLWIAMRLAEGPDLRELLRREGPLSPERTVALLAGIAAALDAAHAKGLLHRDVKPANILLVPGPGGGTEHVYLADFGLATAAHGRGITRTGELLGTVDYVSPEQARGEPLDARSDVYSLAAVLYECLAGVAPFHRETELASLTARLEAPAPPLSSVRPDLPAALDPVLARGLARDPAERYPSAGTLLAAATAAVHGGSLRGLLFADLRGYTAFAEREGDARAAALLARYRGLVRIAVARTGGAEVRTEGDSFYVVFPSATAAIRAGLAIVAAAAQATAEDPSLPLHPGVGVHAGEPLAAPEGPVGAAVNSAARLCDLAGPGEVLVSATARDLARGSHDLAFAARGSHPVKGLAEPLAAWAASPTVPGDAPAPAPVTAEPAPSTRRAPTRRVLLGIAAGAGALLLVVLAYAAVTGRPATTPAASPGVAAATPSGGLGSPGGASGSPPGSTAATATPPLASPTSGPFPTVVEAAILAALPADLAGTCVRGGTRDDARLAGFTGLNFSYSITPSSQGGVTCRPAAGPARLYVLAPARAPEWVGDVTSPADQYLGYLTGVHDIPSGSCAAGSRAYERWTGPSGSGQVACMNPFDGRPWIYFTFARGRYLAFATRDDADYGALYAWWQQLKTFLP